MMDYEICSGLLFTRNVIMNLIFLLIICQTQFYAFPDSSGYNHVTFGATFLFVLIFILYRKPKWPIFVDKMVY